MNEIVGHLSKSRFEDSEEIDKESSFLMLKTYYEKNERHRYSEISKTIYSLEDERIDILRINLNSLIDHANEDKENRIIKNITKLIDHADLAQYQRKFIEDKTKESDVRIRGIHNVTQRTRTELRSSMQELKLIKEDTKIARQELKDTEEKLQKDYEKVTVKIDEQKSSVYTQFVTILGIFSAIVFASFGGLEMLNNILGNMKEVSTPKLLIFSSFSLGAIITILFILLAGITRITEKSFSGCGCKPADKCKHTVYTKHPSIILLAFLLFYIAIIGAFGFIIDYKELLSIKALFSVNLKSLGTEETFLMFLVIYPLVTGGIFLYKRYKDGKTDKNLMDH